MNRHAAGSGNGSTYESQVRDLPVFRSGGHDPFTNQAIEETLFSAEASPPRFLLLYVNDPCVVIGRNQNPWIEMAAGARVPALRRCSGGGAVYHDRGNLNWAIVTPRREHDALAELGLVAMALDDLGIEAESGPRGGLFAAGGGEFHGQKLSGTARRMSSSRVLHHGTLLVDADLEGLRSCLGGIAALDERSVASVPAKAVNCSSIVAGLGIADLESAMAATIAGRGCVPDSAEDAVLACAGSSILEETRNRLCSWEWVWGQTLPFSLRVPGDGIDMIIHIRKGLVAGLEGRGAALIEGDGGVMGTRFSYDLPGRLAGRLR